MYRVKKRDGELVDFNINKISAAIKKAFEATGTEYNDSVIDFLSLKVTADFQDKITDGAVTVEDVQDSVEAVLSRGGYEHVAKAYILYRRQREKLRNMKNTYLDYKNVVDSYINNSDWRVKENSTVNYSIGGLILSNSGAITANYWLSEIYDDEIANAHKNADLHLHDLSMLTGYCAGWSLKQLIQEGLGGIPGKITSSPAKHLSTLCNQMVNFLGILQNEWAGAQAFSSFDTYLAPFVKVDDLSYDEVKQCIQSFVYGVNTPSRWGTQAPFSNITLDWTVPSDLKDQKAIVGGKEMDFTYGDCKKEMDMVNKAFIDIMIEGDANGRGFQYPIPTYSITRDFDWSPTENNKLLFEMTAKYGTPYFSNYINSDMEPSDVRSMCCRLRLDLRELRRKSGGYFGSGESTGSIGVVTLNMPRLAYLAKDENDFFRRLDRLMDIAARSLKVKREVVTKLLNEGLYPYTRRYLGSFDNHFSTIGLVGMNEAGLNAKWIRADMTHESCQEFTKKTLQHMLEPPAGLSGAVRRPLQPGGHPGREHLLPPRQARCGALSRHHHRRRAGRDALLHQQLPPARGLHRGHLRRPRRAGRASDPVHLRHRLPRLPGREAARLAGRGLPCAQDRRELQAALLHAQPHLLRLQEPRLSQRRAVHLPALRRERGGLQPHHRLLPPRAELERRQDAGVQGAQDLRRGAQPPRPREAPRGLRLRRGAGHGQAHRG